MKDEYRLDAKLVGSFFRNKFVEVDALFSEEMIAALIKEHHSSASDKKERFISGRDRFTKSKELSKTLFPRAVMTIASQLTKQRQMRPAISQFFAFPNGCDLLPQKEVPFQDLFAISPILLGAIVQLGTPADSTLTLVPTQKGNVIFFDPKEPCPWQELQGTLLLLGFGSGALNYTKNSNDPCSVHYMRQNGYIEGQLMSGETHPIISC